MNGVYLLDFGRHTDSRGDFRKLWATETLAKQGITIDMKETFFSISQKGVIRGMHLQLPPFEQVKLVSFIKGRVRDILLDLRKDSPTYREHVSMEIAAEDNKSLYIPAGIAHGFHALEDDTTVLYLSSAEYSPENDTGVLWDSFGADWGIDKPVVSERDTQLPTLDDFDSPFGGNA